MTAEHRAAELITAKTALEAERSTSKGLQRISINIADVLVRATPSRPPESRQPHEAHPTMTSIARAQRPIDYPTRDEINALPDRFRRYIHDLAIRTDKTDELRTIVHLQDDREALQQRVEELEAELADLRTKLGR
jgi:hypothetical protein